MYYKVLANDLQSPIAPLAMKIEYVPGVWMKPTLGKLMIFDSLENAEVFWLRHGGCIFSCKAKGVTAAPPIMPNTMFSTRSEIAEFWHKGVVTNNYLSPPKGTRLAATVLILKRIK